LLRVETFEVLSMHLVQMLLPLNDKEGKRFPNELFDTVREELLDKFGGVTVFTQSPVEGLWKPDKHAIRDHLLIYEVMADVLAESWWHAYRSLLEERFAQDYIVIRSQQIQLL
jgi:hypothetical protein